MFKVVETNTICFLRCSFVAAALEEEQGRVWPAGFQNIKFSFPRDPDSPWSCHLQETWSCHQLVLASIRCGKQLAGRWKVRFHKLSNSNLQWENLRLGLFISLVNLSVGDLFAFNQMSEMMVLCKWGSFFDEDSPHHFLQTFKNRTNRGNAKITV